MVHHKATNTDEQRYDSPCRLRQHHGDADFDGPLKQGLLVQLGQSPYINIFPEERARETLELMERTHDEKITRETGREICLRRGIKVLLVGTIASLGRNYVITLEAINSQSGEAIAQQQTEAEGKEEVLKALGRASTSMREKLGESLASIRQFDAPIEQATTASLEAFKDYTIGVDLWRKGQYAQSVPALKRAVERDSEFALAYAQLVLHTAICAIWRSATSIWSKPINCATV